jgi:hypothetical protein
VSGFSRTDACVRGFSRTCGLEMKAILGLLVVVGFLVASPGLRAQQVPRLGTIGERLTNRDVEEIAALAKATVSSIYLLAGDRSQVLPETWLVEVYLAPTPDRGRVRRGPVVNVSKVVEEGSLTAWRVDGETRYAQVAAPGRRFPTALTSRDNDRPFLLEGEFTDDELVSIVSFIRSSPEQPSKKAPNGTIYGLGLPVEGALPIGTIRRTGKAEVMVILAASQRHGQTVSLRRSRDRWLIVEVVFWIA